LDRACELPALGKVDREKGEFWVTNPFQMPSIGANLSAFERNRLFMNVPGEAFIDASFASAVDIDSDSRAVIAADFDRDGAVDLLVGNVGGGPLRLFRNRFPRTNKRVRIELIGTESNRSAIGSRVIAEFGDQRIVRDVFPANGCMGAGPPELILGVGEVEQIPRLHVRWPTGMTETFSNVPVDERISVTEGKFAFSVLEW
jgi:hypothetical protein